MLTQRVNVHKEMLDQCITKEFFGQFILKQKIQELHSNQVNKPWGVVGFQKSHLWEADTGVLFEYRSLKPINNTPKKG